MTLEPCPGSTRRLDRGRKGTDQQNAKGFVALIPRLQCGGLVMSSTFVQREAILTGGRVCRRLSGSGGCFLGAGNGRC